MRVQYRGSISDFKGNSEFSLPDTLNKTKTLTQTLPFQGARNGHVRVESCVPFGWSVSGSVIQDHSEHGASKELMKLLWSQVHHLLWCTMIWVILDQWSWYRSPQRDAPFHLFFFAWKLVSFDPWSVACSPLVGKLIWIWRHNDRSCHFIYQKCVFRKKDVNNLPVAFDTHERNRHSCPEDWPRSGHEFVFHFRDACRKPLVSYLHLSFIVSKAFVAQMIYIQCVLHFFQ